MHLTKNILSNFVILLLIKNMLATIYTISAAQGLKSKEDTCVLVGGGGGVGRVRRPGYSGRII